MSAAPETSPTPNEAVMDGLIIAAFPRLAEWCIERMDTDSDQCNARKNEVWELMREVVTLRRSVHQPTGYRPCDPSGKPIHASIEYWARGQGETFSQGLRCLLCGEEIPLASDFVFSAHDNPATSSDAITMTRSATITPVPPHAEAPSWPPSCKTRNGETAHFFALGAPTCQCGQTQPDGTPAHSEAVTDAPTRLEIDRAVATYEAWDEGDMWLSRCLDTILTEFVKGRTPAGLPPNDGPCCTSCGSDERAVRAKARNGPSEARRTGEALRRCDDPWHDRKPNEEEKLVAFFRSPDGEGIGRQGDHDNLSPADTAIRAMRALLDGQRVKVRSADE